MEPQPPDGDDAAGGGALRHRDPQLRRPRPRVTMRSSSYLERVLALDADASIGPGDVRRHLGERVGSKRPAKSSAGTPSSYQVRGRAARSASRRWRWSAGALLERKDATAGRVARRTREEQAICTIYALMITDVVAKGTQTCSSPATLPRSPAAFGVERSRFDSSLDLPGVMSRKKEVIAQADRDRPLGLIEAASDGAAPALRPTAARAGSTHASPGVNTWTTTSR